MSWHLNGRTIAKYPTPAAWRAATRSMLATVGPALKSAGLLAVPNLSAPWAADYDAQATWSDWLQFTSGAAQEYYSKWGSASSSWFADGDWTYRQKFQTLTEQAGKIFIGITYAPKSDTRSMAWARANFLLFDEPANNSALMFELERPRGAGSVRAELDGGRRHARRGPLPGRLGLAPQLQRRHGARQPDRLGGHRPTPAAVPRDDGTSTPR